VRHDGAKNCVLMMSDHRQPALAPFVAPFDDDRTPPPMYGERPRAHPLCDKIGLVFMPADSLVAWLAHRRNHGLGTTLRMCCRGETTIYNIGIARFLCDIVARCLQAGCSRITTLSQCWAQAAVALQFRATF
jgi:hypothetical protein